MRKRKRELITLYNEESSRAADQEDPKRRKMADLPHPEQWTAFLRVLDTFLIRCFLARDSCHRISDKYLLAMTLEYLRRAEIPPEKYRTYFFPSLFLANQMEEDLDFHREIFLWAHGALTTIKKRNLLEKRDRLLVRIGFKALIERDTCDRIMAQHPEHWVWTRERKEHHSRSIRWFRRSSDEYDLYGPLVCPPPCSLCATLNPSQEEDQEPSGSTQKTG